MVIPTPAQMMEAHVHLNLGVYFDEVRATDDLVFATSRTIPDFYWNYAYGERDLTIEFNRLESIPKYFESIGRQPAIYQLGDTPAAAGWELLSHEAWMWIAAAAIGAEEGPDSPSLDIRAVEIPTPEMREVFEDAYSSDAAEAGTVGYFKLPPEYGKAYASSRIHPPGQLIHFGIWVGGTCASVASIAIWRGIAGLYSVGTRHSERRRGLGATVSRAAMKWAAANGASGILLQTIADSEVEAMYRSLGFVRTHTGMILGDSTR